MNRVSGLEIASFRDLEHAAEEIINQDGEVKYGFALAVNAEKIISMRKYPDVRKLVESATLRYPDGIGVVWALRKKGVESSRIPGCDLWQIIMQTAGQKKVPVFLVGSTSDTLIKTTNKLRSLYNTNIVGSQDGYFENEDELIDRIVASGAEIITVAMGSPKQEKFINKCREKSLNAFYMGVGGSYDVFVGNVKRAPIWAQKSNLEWFYRAIKQPYRLFRQYVLLEFLFLLLSNKL